MNNEKLPPGRIVFGSTLTGDDVTMTGKFRLMEVISGLPFRPRQIKEVFPSPLGTI